MNQQHRIRDHGGVLWLIELAVFLSCMFSVFLNVYYANQPDRTELRCSAFVHPPKGCTP